MNRDWIPLTNLELTLSALLVCTALLIVKLHNTIHTLRIALAQPCQEKVITLKPAEFRIIATEWRGTRGTRFVKK